MIIESFEKKKTATQYFLMMSLSEFLKDLPTHNRDNFTRLQTDASGVGRPHHGQVKKDIPSPRIVPTVAYMTSL